MSNLGTLLEKQKRLAELLGIKMEREAVEWLPHLLSAATHIMVEGAELVDALDTATKPWKRKTYEDVAEHAQEESIDVLFMLLEVWCLMGLTGPQIYSLYQAKYRKNLVRILASSGSVWGWIEKDDPQYAEAARMLMAMGLNTTQIGEEVRRLLND